MLPWDQRIARVLVRPLSNTWVQPNHITALTLCMAITAGTLFSLDNLILNSWAAGIFVVSRFLDHFDGELARLQGATSKFGYYFDYVVGGVGYSALFLGLGLGHWQGELGGWALVLGISGAISALLSLWVNLKIDSATDHISFETPVGYPSYLGFELEDGIYLLAPITWLGFLKTFFVAAGIGASIYCIWTTYSFLRIRFR